MSLSLLALYCAFVLVLMRAVLDRIQPHHSVPSCDQCGLPRERRELGEQICGCVHG